ncbi:MXAN_6230/SCO0854 family RING domain-containing protein [Streptomyces sp. NPDC052015]|uniref:MXAN_6230/SCO0854 family RING domain-containing protein n=1 Tax=Streptomyces sp. NPDC052015 TaxID=3154755 RepID=UPI0034373EED
MSVLASVLLRRLRTVYVDQAGPRPGDPSTDEGLVALEAELLERGFAPNARLRAALAWLGPAGLADAGRQLVAHIDAELGADRTHMPLFRTFPASVPDDTFQLWVDRVFTLLLQWPKQPCVLCGTVGSVHPVAPCAHLVCRECWDGADYSGCPLCHRRVDPADPFLKPAPPRHAREMSVGPLKLLALGRDARADAVTALRTLLARRTPLPPRDREDLAVLLAHAPAGVAWFPEEIPVRETKALVLGRMLRARDRRADALELIDGHLTTATDVLRLLCVWSGGEADLIEPPRLPSLPRGLRRRLLAVLDGLPAPSLVEDVLRHPVLWKRAAEILHPYEQHVRHPKAALAFAVLRGTDVSVPAGSGAGVSGASPAEVPRRGAGTAGGTASGRSLPDAAHHPGAALAEALLRTAAAHPNAVRADGSRLRAVTWSARVEQALAEKDIEGALALLARRPGELLRRLDHLLRLRPLDALPEGFAEVLRRVLPQAGPAPLLAALGRLRIRHVPSERRVFFPRGQVTHAYTVDDTRPPLSPAVTREVCALLEAEAVRRLSAAPRVELAVLDSGLTGLAVPATERADTKTLVAVPRGSTQPLPEGEVMRLFLHWTEPAKTRVDLDLSVALYDENWEFVDLCDYTNLVYGDRWAVHSGDLTSAPAPRGATEYVDLDLTALGGLGVRYALPVVFSYNDIPFERLLDAFAGFMTLASAAEEDRDASYDPRTVRQRYDLVGDSRVHVPLIVDLRHRTFLWTDLHVSAAEGYHNVHRHAADLGRAGRDLYQYFASGRTTLWDLAVWHAAARADEVAVVRRAPRPGAVDELWHYVRRDGERDTAFAARVRALEEPERRERPEGGDGADGLAAEAAAKKRVLLALVHGGVAPERACGEVYRLLPGPVDGCGLTPLAAGDLVAALG